MDTRRCSIKLIKGFFIQEKEANPPHQEQIAINIYIIKLFFQHPCRHYYEKGTSFIVTLNFLRAIHEVDEGYIYTRHAVWRCWEYIWTGQWQLRTWDIEKPLYTSEQIGNTKEKQRKSYLISLIVQCSQKTTIEMLNPSLFNDAFVRLHLDVLTHPLHMQLNWNENSLLEFKFTVTKYWCRTRSTDKQDGIVVKRWTETRKPSITSLAGRIAVVAIVFSQERAATRHRSTGRKTVKTILWPRSTSRFCLMLSRTISNSSWSFVLPQWTQRFQAFESSWRS